MNLTGTLADWTIVDLLAMLKVTKKTGTLRIKGDRSGHIHFVEGRVAAANVEGPIVLDGDGGHRTGAIDTLFLLSSFTEGQFELGDYEGPESDGWDVDDLMADMGRLQELEGDVAEAGLTTQALILTDSIPSAITVAPDDWWAIASLVSVLSLEQLEEVFGRARAIRMLHTLWRLGVTEVVADVTDLAPQSTDPATPAAESIDLDTPAGAIGASQPDDTWLDEIAIAAGGSAEEAPIQERRALTGLSAPASTTLTGSVLDEMRRLRGRAGS
ncbi:hypothetical protein BH23ACT5_BH23ACT5_16990 [soil metagenome]